MKQNLKSNKLLWIFLTIIAYSFVLVGWQFANFSNTPFMKFVAAGETAQVTILWDNAAIFLAFMVAPVVILLVKCFAQTYPAYKNNKKTNLVKATLIVEIISIIILLVSVFSIFMHKQNCTLPPPPIPLKPIELYIPIYVFVNLSFGLILADTALSVVSWSKK